MHRLRLLPLVLLMACSSAEDVDLDDGDSESALAGPCAIGAGCPDLKVLLARSFTSRPPAVRRTDVTVPLADGQDLRVFSRQTSRVLQFDGTKKVTLAGDASGAAPVRVDDFLLIEVLSPSGALLDAGAVNSSAVRVAGRDAKALAPIPAHGGLTIGWSYDAGSVDITSLLPTNAPFRLRVSAFDVAGPALATDVFLKVDAKATPPVPPPAPPPVPPTNDDAYDPASCTGTPATPADLADRFAAGTTLAYLGNYTVQARTRDCNAISGCTAWRVATDAIDMTRQAHDQPPPNGDPLTGALMLSINRGKIFPQFVNATCWASASASPTGQVCTALADHLPPASQGGFKTYGWGCWDLTNDPGQTHCGGYSYVSAIQYSGSQRGMQPVERILRGWRFMPADADNMPKAHAFIGKSCARVSGSLVSANARTGDRSEVQVAALVRY